jgi:hypothetical protein
MKGIVNRCNDEYTLETLDTINYTMFWKILNESKPVDTNDAFLYTPPNQTGGIHFWGSLQWYPPGGYISNLGESLKTAESVVEILESSNWLDRYTRVMFVEFNVWNPSTNLFNLVILSFEFFEHGGIVTWEYIDSINLYRYAGAGGLINLLSELILTIIFIVWTVYQIIAVVKTKQKYFKEFWNCVKCICIIFFFTAICIYVWRSMLTSEKVEDIMNNRGMFS